MSKDVRCISGSRYLSIQRDRLGKRIGRLQDFQLGALALELSLIRDIFWTIQTPSALEKSKSDVNVKI